MSVQTESDVIEKLLPDLKAQGYEVYLRPDARFLPAFLGKYTPDLIALGPDKNLAIEIKKPSNSIKLDEIKNLFKDQDRWEFRVVWLNPIMPNDEINIQPIKSISDRILQIKDVNRNDNLEGAFLLGWATFEALARLLLPAEFQRPQTPGRLVDILAKKGYVTPDEADILRRLAHKRNKLIHGDLQATTSADELTSFTKVMETLIAEAA